MVIGAVWIGSRASGFLTKDDEPSRPPSFPPITLQPWNNTLGDLDCSDFLGPVYVGTYDPYTLDADGDGIGCEPYP